MKIFKIFLLLFVLLIAFGGTAFADTLQPYGKDWSFMVSEPPGWKGISTDANKHQVNLYFPMPGYDINSSPVLIYARVMEKKGLTVKQSLEADMRDFSLRKKTVDFLDFPVGTLNYEYASKKYVINQDQVDYLCYIDPGPDSPYYAIFVITGPKGECDKYLNDFLSLLRSFKWLRVTSQ
jgi:hypothetical protein